MQKQIAFFLFCSLLYSNINCMMHKQICSKNQQSRDIPSFLDDNSIDYYQYEPKSPSPIPYQASAPDYSEVRPQPSPTNIYESQEFRPHLTTVEQTDEQNETLEENPVEEQECTPKAKAACVFFSTLGGVGCILFIVAVVCAQAYQ